MRLAVALLGLSNEGSYEAEAERAARLGFNAFVPTFDETRDFVELPAVRETMDRLGVEPVALNAYTNLVHPDAATRAGNVARMQAAVRAATALNCPWVTTMAGTRDPTLTFWAYHPENFGDEAWRCLVESVHQVLDGASEATAGLTLEPYMLTPLSSADRLRQVVDEFDSPRLRLMLDPVNIIPPADYHRGAAMLRRMFEQLGPWIVGAHAKDHYLHRARATVQIDERIPGQGELDYDTFVRCLDALPGAAMIIEHLKEDDQILIAKRHIAEVAVRVGVTLSGDNERA